MIHAQVRAGSPNVVYVEEEKVIRVGYVSVANTDVDICAGQGGPNVVYVEGAIKRGGEWVNTQEHHVLCILL